MASLLFTRRFGPFFLTQFLGALNDNLLKNGLVILVAFQAAYESQAGMLSNLAAGLFILPFFLFSPVAGQMADKYDKARLMRAIKIAEVAIMAAAAWGFIAGHTVLLFITLFLMGVHSAFFGPVKYSVLPHHLRDDELMGGNAWVETGTFLAILIGTLVGGWLVGLNSSTGMWALGILMVTASFAGWSASLRIPAAAPVAAEFKLNFNPFGETLALTRLIAKTPAVLNSVLGISWFWFFGATLLAQLPSFVRHTLRGDESVATMLLAVFAVAVGLGSLLCAKLARGEIELGLVPIGALGLTVFASDLAFISYPENFGGLVSASAWISGMHAFTAWRVIADFFLIGLSGSLFIVPLYALIQARSAAENRSRVIAANNLLNAVFMVASALITMALYQLGFSTVQILLYTAILNAVISLYIFLLIPEFFMRFAVWMMAGTIYRLRYSGRENLPRQGAAVLICNHISFIDWFIITAACNRPVRFVMDHKIFNLPLLGWVFKLCKAIPIAPGKESEAVKASAFAAIGAALRDGDLVCIFPEGKITYDGKLSAFKPGVKRILAADPVPVIPMALTGLWGSFFSRKGGRAMATVPKPSRRIIGVHAGEPLPANATVEAMEIEVLRLLTHAPTLKSVQPS
jgi:1-acyl-sn-glycerol-3-phosphate acyltransferase